MKILVTGGVGFIGTNLISKLLQNGHTVMSIDNYETGFVSNEHSHTTYIHADVNDINIVTDTDFDIVFHLAALSRIQPSFKNPTATFKANVEGTLSVLEWAKLRKIKTIYAGSSSRWHDPFKSPYALSKHVGEEWCKLYKNVYNLDVEIARFYNVYGPREILEGDWAAVIGKWRGQVLRNEPITIVGDGEQRRDFTHVDDIVDGLIRIAVSDKHHDDAWELGTGNNYSINEVYEMFRLKYGISKIHLPDQPGNYRKTLRENNAALEELGWTPTDRLQQYIQSL